MFGILNTPIHLAPQRISSSLGNYVTIHRTRRSGRAPLRGARSGIQWKFNIIKLFLDPGSRPALRDLAGMTNCDTVYWGEREIVVILRSKSHNRFWISVIVICLLFVICNLEFPSTSVCRFRERVLVKSAIRNRPSCYSHVANRDSLL